MIEDTMGEILTIISIFSIFSIILAGFLLVGFINHFSLMGDIIEDIIEEEKKRTSEREQRKKE